MGLGNQMFKYAAGKALSIEKKVPFKVDISSYEGYKLRKYELDTLFNIDTEKASKKELEEIFFTNPIKRVWNKIFSKKLRMLGLGYEEALLPRTILTAYNLVSSPEKRKIYEEPHYHFHKSFFKASGNTYLNGYWMSWKYFQKYEKEIRKEFTIRENLVNHLDEISSIIQSKNSVSIHIRRGDFTTKRNVELHGVIPIDFYKKAIEVISQKISNIELFVFSDDIEWVKENLISRFPVTFISNDVTKNALEDFYLMTVCKHNIIANSTFSWWAAWLNSNTDKIIIAPKKWYNTSQFNYKDVYPISWIIIDH
jgi:hypothetical protein